jgi:hypothetical protein
MVVVFGHQDERMHHDASLRATITLSGKNRFETRREGEAPAPR